MKARNYMIIAISLLVVGCGSGGTGTTSGTSSNAPAIANGLDLPAGTNALLSVRASTGSSAQALTVDAGGATVILDTVLIGLKEIQLRTLETSDTEASETELSGPFIVDLINGTVQNCGTSNIDDDSDDDGISDSQDSDDDDDGIPDASDDDDDNDGVSDQDDNVMGETVIFDALTLPAGVYKSIEAKLDDVSAEDCPDFADSPLINNSLYADGTIDGVPFLFREEFDADFELEDPQGITVGDTSIASFILTFNIAAWFQGVDLSGATPDGNGVIILDKDNNTDLQDLIKQNVEGTAEIENDEDGDGTPDSDDS